MRKLLILLFFPLLVQAQKQPVPSPTPTALTTFTFNVKPADSTLWGYSGTTWLWWNILSKYQADKLYAPHGSGAVSSVFGRTGAVTAQSGDYSSFYPLLNGTGATGTWGISITGAAGSVTNALTAGYGLSGSSFNGNAARTFVVDTAGGIASKVYVQGYAYSKAQADARFAPISGGGYVTSVSGTTNRITSTGGTTPVIDISGSYVGQSSITTLGTVTTGVWNGTAIANANLANSSITIGSTSTSLGGTSASLTGLTSLGLTNGAGTTTLSGSTTSETIAFPALSGTVPIFAVTPVASGIVGWSGTSGAITNITALPNGTTATTQSAGDNSTKVATTAYVDAASPSISFGTFGSTPNANGGSYSAGVITNQPADGTHPGGVTTGTQTFAGAKTLTSALTVSNNILADGLIVQRNGSGTVGVGAYLELSNVGRTRGWLTQLNASNGLDYWYNDGSSYTIKGGLSNTGALYSAALTNGLVKSTSGVLGNAVSNTDYLPVAAPTYTGAMNGGTLVTTGGINIKSASDMLLGEVGVSGGRLLFASNADPASRTWRFRPSLNSNGDLVLQQSTTQTGSTYADILRFNAGGDIQATGALAVNGHTTFEGVTSTGATGTGKLVYDNTATLITPVIGAATGTSLTASSLVQGQYFVASGAQPGINTANRSVFDNVSGSYRSFAYGSDNSTNGNYIWYTARANGTNLIAGLQMDDAGVLTTTLGTGAVQATAGVLSVISDSKAKDLHGKYKGSALSAINTLDVPQYWNYNSKSKLGENAYKVNQFGLLADEVHEKLGEEFAPTQGRYDNKGDFIPTLIDGKITYGLSDRALLSLAIQAIQELQAEVKSLKK